MGRWIDPPENCRGPARCIARAGTVVPADKFLHTTRLPWLCRSVAHGRDSLGPFSFVVTAQDTAGSRCTQCLLTATPAPGGGTISPASSLCRSPRSSAAATTTGSPPGPSDRPATCGPRSPGRGLNVAGIVIAGRITRLPPRNSEGSRGVGRGLRFHREGGVARRHPREPAPRAGKRPSASPRAVNAPRPSLLALPRRLPPAAAHPRPSNRRCRIASSSPWAMMTVGMLFSVAADRDGEGLKVSVAVGPTPK